MAQFGDFTVDRNSTKYVLGSGGTIISYATDEPAFEFNADGSYKGLLVEPAATNICLQSEDFGTTWLTANATITTNDTTAPDGTTTADTVNEGATTGVHELVQFVSGYGSSGAETASVYLKAGTCSTVQLLWDNMTGSNDWANFDLSSGIAGTSAAGVTATIVDAGGGWYRCAITGTVDGGNSGFYIIPTQSSSASRYPSFTGTSRTFFVWGAQVETGPIATSYIPTTTASVTRVKDDITQTSASSLIGQTEGTLYVEVDWRLTNGTAQELLGISNGTTSNKVVIFKNPTDELRMYAIADGNIATLQGESSTAYSGIQKIAFAYKTNDFELYRNGSSISSDTSGSLAALATLTDIDLGQTFDALFQVNMHIRAVALYPKRLSDAEAQALTTL